ncbi:MAG: hypothetical protein IJZ35_06760 [Clostridia bacterium]|nr:hypothetical protein [Clostridia bacterium]
MTVTEQNVKINYLLGIDAGGTKTEFLLTDLNGKELERVILGAANPINVGIDNAEKILEQGISQVCGNINRREISVYAGLAGGISGNNKLLINKFLSGLGFGASANGSDTDNALEVALKGGNGVVVIMGTGIVAFSQNEGIRHRTGGWGYLIDKGGSGFTFGSDALNSALEYYDGRGGSKLLLQLIENKLNKPLPECIPDICSGGATYTASFAPIVFEAFEQGDKEAEKITDRNCAEVAKIIRTCCSHLSCNSRKVVLCGGMCRKQDILKPFISKHLGEGYNIDFLTEPVVNGAVSLAKANIKKDGE